MYDVLDCLAGGMTEDAILSDFPDLTRDDIRAALAFATARELSGVELLFNANVSHKLVGILARGFPVRSR